MSPHKQSSQENFHSNGEVNGEVDGMVDGMAQGIDRSTRSTKYSTRPTYTNVLDKFNIAGKVYIVTGGGRGLGLALCEALLEADAYGMLCLLPDRQNLTNASQCYRSG